MPEVQGTYQDYMDAARVGQLADTGHKDLISRNAETPTPDDVIGFGMPVSQGASDRGAHITKAGDTAVIGITARTRAAVDGEWKAGQSMRVLSQGVIWVMAQTAVAAGGTVHVDDATGGWIDTGGVTVDGANYETSGAAGELVRVRLK